MQRSERRRKKTARIRKTAETAGKRSTALSEKRNRYGEEKVIRHAKHEFVLPLLL